MGTKADLRKNLKSRLASLSDQDYLELSLKVSVLLKHLLNDLHVIQQHLVIGVFAPIEKEPKWFLDMEDELEKLTAYPAYAKDRMVFRLAPRAELEITQDFGVGILGPKLSAKEMTPKIIIVPGLGFTSDGKRLGRGKGFYDRYLEEASVIKIGIGFEMQIEQDIPTDPHDVKMDFVVTDHRILKINR
ncbi:5-formyltetrahydrofolate cyclo-ligase [Bacteriovorax sp. PP10]|uniref:5-formyltetrahydrofolate cyclo-ligase n=1 Tax=Bacteriovorax antarcticus TaxID=3088717 RepID=A0ABU5VRP5_9BACT|nr:5-formyltetrahydrofolate cyclo-ligase [Bacteriovorax sp. PP10]MEA9355034.1 5-formyltetrahydrofolate cyclo-ligase [Bacteriovorax sp. PP10]